MMHINSVRYRKQNGRHPNNKVLFFIVNTVTKEEELYKRGYLMMLVYGSDECL